MVLVRQGIIQGNGASTSIAFVNEDGAEAVFTHRGANAFGYVFYQDGTVYILENCGQVVVLLKLAF